MLQKGKNFMEPEERFDSYVSIITKDESGIIRSEFRRKLRCAESLLFIKDLDALYLKHHPDAKPQEWMQIVDTV